MSENAREQTSTLSKKSLLHQTSVAFLHLAPQYVRLGCQIRRQHSNHAVVHVRKHLLAQWCWQRLNEACRIKWGFATFTILIRRQSRLLGPLLGQHLSTTTKDPSFSPPIIHGDHFLNQMKFHDLSDFSTKAGKDSSIFCLTLWPTVVVSHLLKTG